MSDPLSDTDPTVRSPRKMTPKIMDKLEEALKLNFSIDRACRITGISRDTYYRWCKEDEAFLTKMDRAKEFASALARSTVQKAMEKGDGHLALRYLERTDSEQFSTKRENEHRENITINLISYSDRPKEVIEIPKGHLEEEKNGEPLHG